MLSLFYRRCVRLMLYVCVCGDALLKTCTCVCWSQINLKRIDNGKYYVYIFHMLSFLAAYNYTLTPSEHQVNEGPDLYTPPILKQNTAIIKVLKYMFENPNPFQHLPCILSGSCSWC